jgi:ABC-type glycerol-3-phosphate transport system substrate-binding protein
MLQLRDRNEDIHYASYWGFTVAKSSKNVNTAWELIDFMSQSEQVKKYLTKAKMPVARRDFILWQQQDSDLKHFANQILSARSWYKGDSLAVDTILTDMLREARSGEKKTQEALEDAAARVTVILQKIKE